MSNFIKDTKLIDEKIKLTDKEELRKGELQVVFLPYYVDPKTLKLMTVLKREIAYGGYVRTGRKMGISALTTVLPIEKPLTVEEAFEKLNLQTTIQNAIPFGSVMLDPINSTEAFELVLVQVEPIIPLDAKTGIVHQVKGQYEIGLVPFDDILDAIQSNLIQDLKTRMILSELYIMALEESNKLVDNNPGLASTQNDKYNFTPEVENQPVKDEIPYQDMMHQASIYSTKK